MDGWGAFIILAGAIALFLYIKYSTKDSVSSMRDKDWEDLREHNID
jgi:hypothetical protein